MSLDELKQRESQFFLPVVNRLPLALVEGRGARVRDVDGREYTDLTAGWGVTCIGHCHPALVEAISEQAGRLKQGVRVCGKYQGVAARSGASAGASDSL
jgi:acetylornithine/N-succinyldiaminopimelate aminotransferase